MDQLVMLAKEAIEAFVLRGETINVPDYIDESFKQHKAGVFVSLKINNHLRGCIGTFMPVTNSIAEEVIRNAIAAASEDPRFHPLTADELERTVFSVDILSAPERATDISMLDPKKYGVIVVSGYRKGLLLPDLEGVDTVEEQLRITRMKAGIPSDEDIEIFRFEVKRHH